MTPELVDHAHTDSCAVIGCNLAQPRRKMNMFISGCGWLGSRVVSVLVQAKKARVQIEARHCRVTVLGKLFTPIVPLFTKQQTCSSPLKDCGGNCRPGEKVMAAYLRVYDSRHLQADCQEPGSAAEPYAR